jgi:hypothetical protein
MKTPLKTPGSIESSTVVRAVTLHSRWPEHQVLRVTRERTKQLVELHRSRNRGADPSQRALNALLQGTLVEAGWTAEEYLDALCQDMIRLGKQRARAASSHDE